MVARPGNRAPWNGWLLEVIGHQMKTNESSKSLGFTLVLSIALVLASALGARHLISHAGKNEWQVTVFIILVLIRINTNNYCKAL